MGQFKPMVKMETTEPSVILKLKKGGHVAQEHKDDAGHTNMKGKAFLSARAEEAAEEGSSPKKPSMSDRRKAMSGALLNSKKGGKAVKKADGGPMGLTPAGAPSVLPVTRPAGIPMRGAPMRPPMGGGLRPTALPVTRPAGMPVMGRPTALKKGGKVNHEEHEIHKLEKELKHHEHEKAGKAHHGLKAGGKASGAAIDKFEARSAIEGNAGKFAKTKMHDGDKIDKAHGTKDVKEGKTAGYKTGGTISGNVGKFAKTKVDDGDRKDTAHGTGGVKEGKAAGYKKGGTIGWENRPADDGDHFDPAHGTTGVRESNAGGYKKGGAAKKHFATGGSVNNAGRAVAMPHHFVSEPVSNSRQSGTFKKGGKVGKFAEGGLEDASQGAYDRASQPEGMSIARAIRNAPSEAYAAAKRLLGIKPEAGAGRGSVNPPMARKSGGSAKR
jgi:hypothetical protein